MSAEERRLRRTLQESITLSAEMLEKLEKQAKRIALLEAELLRERTLRASLERVLCDMSLSGPN